MENEIEKVNVLHEDQAVDDAEGTAAASGPEDKAVVSGSQAVKGACSKNEAPAVMVKGAKTSLDYQKSQLMWTRLCAIFLAVILVLAIALFAMIAPAAMQLNSTINKIDKIAADLSVVSGKLSTVDWDVISGDVTQISEELSKVDWYSLTGNIDKMAQDAQTSMQAAMKAVDKMDIEGLNKAISDLQTVIAPLAKMMR